MHFTIGAKILGVAVMLVALMIGLSIYSVITVDRIEDRLAVAADSLIPLVGKVAAIDAAALEQEIIFTRLLRSQGTSRASDLPQAVPDHLAQWQAYGTQVRSEIAAVRVQIAEFLRDDDHYEEALPLHIFDRRFADLEREYDDMAVLAERILTLEAENRSDIAEELIVVLEAEEAQFDRKLSEIREEAVALARNATARTAIQEHQARLSTLGLTAAGAALGLLIALAITRGIVRPVRQLLVGFENVEAGDLTIELSVKNRDEIGRLTAGFNHMVGEIRAKEEIKDTFGRYIDPRIVDKIIDQSDQSVMEGERRDMTIYFSDLSGFTRIGEMLTASALVRLLNAYFTRMSGGIREEGGIIDKFIGDAIMAYWGPPFVAQKDMAAAACRAALRNLAELEAFSTDVPEITGLRAQPPQLRCRIGLATGPVVVGNIGSDTNKNYTVMGDTVNLGARLEAANKDYGTQILVCAQTFHAAQTDLHFREIDLLAVKGKSEATAIYEPLGPIAATAPDKLELASRFGQALAAYRAQSWDEAETLFSKCLKIMPDDGPSKTFLTRIEQLRHDPLPNHWDGVWHMQHK